MRHFVDKAHIFLGALVAAALSSQALADDYGRMNVLEENDSLYFHTDKHYTQGVRFSYLAPSVKPGDSFDRPFDYLSAYTPIFAANSVDRRYVLLFGQSIFTPDDLQLRPPDPRDRPYGGWLYGGVSLLQRDGDDSLENLELDAGIIGPGALGKQIQNDWHQFIDIHQAQGWSDQIQNEPGATLTYQRLWRLPIAGGDAFGIDAVPEAGATVGNVFDFGELGGMLRIGSGLGADYGPPRVRPALSGTDYFDSTRAGDGLGGYFYIGTQGRVVGRNIFLDGNSFRQSPSVDHRVFVGDVETGFALFWSRRVRADFSVTERSKEFVGQHSPDVIGAAALSFSL
ncbi:MAG TPA: lipid A deacylase LpxR family protein [Stellaceae bacterium]|nr:lipid A deacylase LpxR family protein [Stellaceae bacterium]